MLYSTESDSKGVQVACWWKGTKLHKETIFAVPLLPGIEKFWRSRQTSPMPIDTQAFFTAEALLNIARGSLGGFYIPSDVPTDSKPRKDNMYRFTFHRAHPEHRLMPGRKILWIKVEGSSLPTVNLTNLHMKSTDEDKRNHPSDWAISVKRDYPDACCPFTGCLLPAACHIIECGQNNEAYEVLPQLSNAIHDILYPKSCTNPTDTSEPEGFLDVRFPIPAVKRYTLASLPHVIMPINAMMLESQFHETYDRYWWLIYRGEALWIHNKTCPLFQVYGWDPQIHPAERDAHQGERKPRKIKQDASQAQLQDLRAIISFYHLFGTSEYYDIIEGVAGDLPPKKRKAREQGGSRKRACSSASYESDDESDTESDSYSNYHMDSDKDEVSLEYSSEMTEVEQCNITAQTMLIWLANCWSIQARRNGSKKKVKTSHKGERLVVLRS
ncbi:hypothetical protein ARMGADRAFT_1171400 [Armillaria gallica]|uniref:Uncharacterized protein n=1 Tax=Armillaria gallica TaxID=47427 RepID=A0A2H3CEA4_ARMGA|nr:hypothetical protein ARMGADRAFT_1171400 [Armillaria gallica]